MSRWNRIWAKALDCAFPMTAITARTSDVLENLDQVPPNTIGFAAASAFAPYPLFGDRSSSGTQSETLNYNAVTVSVQNAFQAVFSSRRVILLLEESLGQHGLRSRGGHVAAMGGLLSNPADPRLDYGNVAFTARQRFLATFLYELPFGKGGVLLKCE